ncbi:MAG: hypothetical protein LUE92_11970 [Clostridiales bacterium]|nr:hypothetical protein [Clostridiales bacterium]
MRNLFRGYMKVCILCKKLTCFFLIFLLTILMFLQSSTVSEAANKPSTSRAIAIVFDNSGSMYQKTAWSRAIYAMEVFASMANEGDQISIYPMHEITAGGSNYTSSSPLTVEGGGDVSVIRDIYTLKSNDTPIETIDDAYNGLMQTDADEKWLVVLTDGAQFYENEEEMSVSETETALSEKLSGYNNDVNLMYLGIKVDASVANPTVEGSYQSEVEIASDSSEILTKLTSMCNTIYGRDELILSGSEVTFDLSMTKLVLFVQGSSIDDLKLVDSQGNEVGTPTASYSPSYSTTEGTGSATASTAYYKDMETDTSLSGEIVTYEDIPAGTYMLQYSGTASSVGVYYEPNVSIAAYFINDEGENVSELDASQVVQGTYSMQYGLVDEEGNFTESELLGDREFTITYSVTDADGNTQDYSETMTSNSSIPIDLKVGDTVDATVEATYLSGYKVSTEDYGDADWPFPIKVVDFIPDPADLQGTISGGADSYTLPDLEETGVYNVALTYQGTQLTGEELSKVTLDVVFDKEGAPSYTTAVSDDGNSIVLSLTYPDGDETQVVQQDYVMTVTASYVEEHDATVTNEIGTVNVSISEYSNALAAEIEGESYYVISQLAEADPLTVKVTRGGEALNAEEMEAASLAVDAGGLGYTVETDAENSQFLIYLSADASQAGNYKINVTATAYDEFGNEVTAEASHKTELQNYPLWLRYLIIALIIAAIIAVIALIMNQKILPKRISVAKSSFMVDGDEVTGKAKLTNYTGGKKHATLTLTSPKSQNNPLAKCSMTLQLEAVDPRSKKSSTRAAIVTNATVSPSHSIESYKIGTTSFSKDPETNKFKKAGARAKKAAQKGGKEDSLNVRLTSNQKCTITGEVLDESGMGTPITFSVTLKYH